jgi:MFS family permease
MTAHRSKYLVRSLILGAGLIKAANFISMPFLALFLAKKSALSAFEIGLIIGLNPLAAILGAFFGGPLSDKLGRKKILLSSLLLTTFVY